MITKFAEVFVYFLGRDIARQLYPITGYVMTRVAPLFAYFYRKVLFLFPFFNTFSHHPMGLLLSVCLIFFLIETVQMPPATKL